MLINFVHHFVGWITDTYLLYILQERYESLLAEKDMEIEMLKDHIEVLLDEQETLNRPDHTEGNKKVQKASGFACYVLMAQIASGFACYVLIAQFLLNKLVLDST